MKSLSSQQSDPEQLSASRAVTENTPPSSSANPPVLTSAEVLSQPSAESAASTAPSTDSTPTLLPNMSKGASVDLELLSMILRTTVENLEAAGMCWRTQTQDGKYLRIVLPLDQWTVDMDVKVLARQQKGEEHEKQ